MVWICVYISSTEAVLECEQFGWKENLSRWSCIFGTPASAQTYTFWVQAALGFGRLNISVTEKNVMITRIRDGDGPSDEAVPVG